MKKPSEDKRKKSADISSPSTPLRGLATYYCCTRGYTSGDNVAAAGPALIRALGGDDEYKGKYVTIEGVEKPVRIVDSCQCYKGTPDERVIDLHPGVFAQIAPLSRGKITVEIFVPD